MPRTAGTAFKAGAVSETAGGASSDGRSAVATFLMRNDHHHFFTARYRQQYLTTDTLQHLSIMATLQKLLNLFEFTLSPSISAILVTFLIALTLPLLLHSYYYRTREAANLPAFLLVGPSGAGKTALLTLVGRL